MTEHCAHIDPGIRDPDSPLYGPPEKCWDDATEGSEYCEQHREARGARVEVSREGIGIHFPGAPTLSTLRSNAEKMQRFTESIGELERVIGIEFICDKCQARQAVAVDDPEQPIWELAGMGWTRQLDPPRHHCPDCSAGRT